MLTSTVTQKGQATIPSSIRESLGLKPGTRVQFFEENGVVKIKALPSLESFRGSLKGMSLPSSSDMERIFAEEAYDRYLKTSKK